MLPPGCDRLFTRPRPTGSCTSAQTIGIELVIFFSSTTAGVPLARITSGASVTSSLAYCLMSSLLPADHRYSTRTFSPCFQPRPANPWLNAMVRAWLSGSPSATVINTPTLGMPVDRWARAANGHATAPPTSVMNSRRFMAIPAPNALKPTLSNFRHRSKRRSLNWVKSRSVSVFVARPVCPHERRSSGCLGMTGKVPEGGPSKYHRYSITSLADSSIDRGTVRPSSFAVLKLTTIRYFVGNVVREAPTALRHGGCDPHSWPSDEIYLGSQLRRKANRHLWR